MKAELKRQKREDAERQKRKRRALFATGTVVATVALVFAFTAASFSPPADASRDAPAGAAGFRRITVEELKALFDRGEVTMIDVRPVDAYLTAHIPGALQIPLARIEGEVEYLPKGKQIVTYCTCPAEESSGQAVQILEHRGIGNAAALQGGLDAWRRRGYPIEAGMPSGR